MYFFFFLNMACVVIVYFIFVITSNDTGQFHHAVALTLEYMEKKD